MRSIPKKVNSSCGKALQDIQLGHSVKISAAKVKKIGAELVASIDEDMIALQKFVNDLNHFVGTGDPEDHRRNPTTL